MHLGTPECHKPFLGHCEYDLWSSFQELLCPEHISYIDVGIPNLGWWFLLGWRSGAYHFESLWPWHWLLASFLGFSCYITAYFLRMCLMLDQFLWGIRHVFVTFVVFFFSPQLILQFYRGCPMVISKKTIIFQGFRVGQTFSRGVQLFPRVGGSKC